MMKELLMLSKCLLNALNNVYGCLWLQLLFHIADACSVSGEPDFPDPDDPIPQLRHFPALGGSLGVLTTSKLLSETYPRSAHWDLNPEIKQATPFEEFRFQLNWFILTISLANFE